MNNTETSHAYDDLNRAYLERDRAAIEFKSRGGAVVGCLGADVPEEFLVAAGILPVRICGDPALGPGSADRYIEGAFDPHVRAQFAQIVVQGAYRYLDHLVVSSSSDALVRVFYYLRALRQAEPELPIPDLSFFDLVHSRVRTSELYNRGRARAFRKLVESWCGQAITDEALAQAAAVLNDNRRTLRQLAELRAPGPPRVSGIEALHIIGASMYLPRDEHTRLLHAFLEQARDRAPLNGVRLFVTGSAQDHSRFYKLVESCGSVIVAEDHDWGNRHFEGEVDPNADPVDAVVDRYHLRSPAAARASITARVNALLEQVRNAQVQGVIAFIYQKDDAPAWDFPEQRAALERQGIPVLLLDHQPYPMGDAGVLEHEIRAFIARCQEVG